MHFSENQSAMFEMVARNTKITKNGLLQVVYI